MQQETNDKFDEEILAAISNNATNLNNQDNNLFNSSIDNEDLIGKKTARRNCQGSPKNQTTHKKRKERNSNSSQTMHSNSESVGIKLFSNDENDQVKQFVLKTVKLDF